jgi:hypothetical protein
VLRHRLERTAATGSSEDQENQVSEAVNLPMPNKRALPKQAAGFIKTMDCLSVSKMPEGPKWAYERCASRGPAPLGRAKVLDVSISPFE